MISGRREVCLLRKRFRSARIFSCITPQSPRSSSLDDSSVFSHHLPRRLQQIGAVLHRHESAAHDFRQPSLLPVCLLMAMIGSTKPSSERWRRSRITMSSTTSSSVPESMHTRPTVNRFALARAVASRSPAFRPIRARTSPPGPRWLRCCASCACFASCRYSPWTGTKKRGRTRFRHQPQLLRAAVPGNVDRRIHRAVDHVRAALGEMVDHPVDALFVSRNDARAQRHRVARLRSTDL
jgi:hypothetical protein